MERRNRNLGLATALAVLGVGAGGEVLPAAPLAKDQKPERRQRSASEAVGIPFPHLKSTRIETVGEPNSNLGRQERRQHRKARMRLRKHRGWR